MSEKAERKKLAVLRILLEAGKPMGSNKVAERLAAENFEISPRTARLYLQSMAEEGLTTNLGRRGHEITELGRDELGAARIIEKVGFLASKIDQLTYRMNFDLLKRKGKVVANISFVEKKELVKASPYIRGVYKAGYAMGCLMGLLAPGEHLGESVVPEGKIGLVTICSVTLNGVLLSYGIPVYSRFGGLLELRDSAPTRFVELIYYSGTTLDPLEVFIKSGMTDYHGAVKNGNGRIGASFREVPAESRNEVAELAEQLKKVGLGGFMMIGWPGQPLMQIPVNFGQVGAIVIGGLNPVAILEEKGIKTHSRALSELIEFESLFHYSELDERIEAIS